MFPAAAEGKWSPSFQADSATRTPFLEQPATSTRPHFYQCFFTGRKQQPQWTGINLTSLKCWLLGMSEVAKRSCTGEFFFCIKIIHQLPMITRLKLRFAMFLKRHFFFFNKKKCVIRGVPLPCTQQKKTNAGMIICVKLGKQYCGINFMIKVEIWPKSST